MRIARLSAAEARPRAEELLREIPGASAGRVIFYTASLAGIQWLWAWLYLKSGVIGMVVGPLAVLVPAYLYVSTRRRNDLAGFRSYLECREQA